MLTEKSSSCLVKKLSCYVELSPEDRELLRHLEGNGKNFGSNDVIHREGDDFHTLFIVQSGWLFSSSDMLDGSRHIVQFHLPGDIIGLSDIAFMEVTSTLSTCTTSEVYRFPKMGLQDVMVSAPRLASLLLALSARDQVTLTDSLRANSHLDARSRVMQLLLTLHYRLRVIEQDMTTLMGCPLTQAQLGDHLGLTNVTVSKVLGKLDSEGWIDRHGDEIRILRLNDMENETGVKDRFTKLDTSWFPPSGRIPA